MLGGFWRAFERVRLWASGWRAGKGQTRVLPLSERPPANNHHPTHTTRTAQGGVGGDHRPLRGGRGGRLRDQLLLPPRHAGATDGAGALAHRRCLLLQRPPPPPPPARCCLQRRRRRALPLASRLVCLLRCPCRPPAPHFPQPQTPLQILKPSPTKPFSTHTPNTTLKPLQKPHPPNPLQKTGHGPGPRAAGRGVRLDQRGGHRPGVGQDDAQCDRHPRPRARGAGGRRARRTLALLAPTKRCALPLNLSLPATFLPSPPTPLPLSLQTPYNRLILIHPPHPLKPPKPTNPPTAPKTPKTPPPTLLPSHDPPQAARAWRPSTPSTA